MKKTLFKVGTIVFAILPIFGITSCSPKNKGINFRDFFEDEIIILGINDAKMSNSIATKVKKSVEKLLKTAKYWNLKEIKGKNLTILTKAKSIVDENKEIIVTKNAEAKIFLITIKANGKQVIKDAELRVRRQSDEEAWNNITKDQIKIIDGITKNKNKKPSEMNLDLMGKKTINGLTGITLEKNGEIEKNDLDGSIVYQVAISKPGIVSRSFTIKYPKQTFRTNLETTKIKIIKTKLSIYKIMTETSNIDLTKPQGRKKVLDYIKGLLLRLSDNEKNAISVVTSTGIIGHKDFINVQFKIQINETYNTHTIKFKRTATNIENIDDIIAKMSNIDRIMSETLNIDLKTTYGRQKVLDYIKALPLGLTNDEKNAISVATNSGIIGHQDFTNVEIVITIGNFRKIHTIKLKRAQNNYEIINDIIAKITNIDGIIPEKYAIDLGTTYGRQKVLDYIKALPLGLTNDEKNAISVATNSGIIGHKDFINVKFKIKINDSETFNTIKFKKITFDNDRINDVIAKLNNIKGTLIEKENIKLRYEREWPSVLNYIKNLPLGLSSSERNAISISNANVEVIEHKDFVNVEIVIKIGNLRKIHIIKLKRAQNNYDIINDIIAKIHNIDGIMSETLDIDLSTTQGRKKVLDYIKALPLGLTNDEKNAISVATNSGIIGYKRFIDVNFQIQLENSKKIHKIRIKRIASDAEKRMN